MPKHSTSHMVEISQRRWLTSKTYELTIQRPIGFDFVPGQRLRIIHAVGERDYSLVSGPDDCELVLCIRLVDRGSVSVFLSSCEIPTKIPISGPWGYFTFKPSSHQAIFVAIGTGIAPFVSMIRSGIRNFILLHGTRQSDQLYYQDLIQPVAQSYIPCISSSDRESNTFFQGRVTDYIEKHLPVGAYDFYLCGSRDMIRDVTQLVDRRFPDSLVYTEMFY